MYGGEGLESLWTLAKIGLFFIALTVLSVLGFGGYWLYGVLT